MRVESNQPEVGAALTELAAVVEDNGGTISTVFPVREKDGHFAAAAGRGEPGRVLLSYPLELRPPMDVLDWEDDPNQFVPRDGVDLLSSKQRRITEAWVTLVNATDKLSQARQSVPRYAVTNWSLRHHLSDAGYPAMRQPPRLEALRNAVIAWHSAGDGEAPPETPEQTPDPVESPGSTTTNSTDPERPRWRLIPLKCFVNHHPRGADQNPVTGQVAVAAATPTDTDETFENYGDLDAMQLLMNFGYLDDAAPLVHSVPVEIESTHLGRVVVRWRAPRNHRGNTIARDVPTLRPTDDGLELHHLTARPDNRGRIAMFLAMAAQASAGLSQAEAHTEAESVVDAIAQANLDYYRRLDELVVAAMASPAPPIAEGFGSQEILPTIGAMSLLQQQRLNQMWGS